MMHGLKHPRHWTLRAHPAVRNVNDLHAQQLTLTEKLCQRIAADTGAPITLLAVIVFQIVWIAIGQLTKMDPFPFVFMLTVSNVVQLVLIVVVAVAGKQQAQHDAIRADEDHATISRLMYHQQAQEMLLLEIAEKLGIDTAELRATITHLAQPDAPQSSPTS
jgi:uncharacterized membrane protein